MFTTKLVIVAFLTFKCIFSKTNVVHAANSLAKNTLCRARTHFGANHEIRKAFITLRPPRKILEIFTNFKF